MTEKEEKGCLFCSSGWNIKTVIQPFIRSTCKMSCKTMPAPQVACYCMCTLQKKSKKKTVVLKSVMLTNYLETTTASNITYYFCHQTLYTLTEIHLCLNELADPNKKASTAPVV